MLHCSIHDILPGMVVGAPVFDPRSPDLRLLLPGVKLDAGLIAGMRTRGVDSAWVEDDLTADLDAAVATDLTGARLEIYSKLRDDLSSFSRKTITSASVQSYRRAVMGLVTHAIASSQFAGMTDTLFTAEASITGMATHAANVAYLSLLCGLQAEAYVITQQPRLKRDQARDMSTLGLAGLLHDIGKTRLPPALRDMHEAHAEAPLSEEYTDHVIEGRKLLEHAHAPARVIHTILNHHQRFDGTGWPDMTPLTAGRHQGPLAGQRIHVYARIVAAANTLDNLMRDAEGSRRPAAAALHAFASSRFDGWFDPVIRRAMLLRVPPFAVGTDVTLNDGRRAVVICPSLDEPCRPIVRIRTAESPDKGETLDLDSPAARPVHITHAMGEDVSPYRYSAPPRFPEDCREAA